MKKENGKRVLLRDNTGFVVIGRSMTFGNVVEEKVSLFDIETVRQDSDVEGRVLLYNNRNELVAIARDVEEFQYRWV